MMFSFTIHGNVRGQGRPRFDSRRKRAYKSSEDRAYERRIKEAYINNGGPHFGSKALEMTIDVYRRLPDSTSLKIGSEADVHRPDCTNIAKAVEDALNGIAYYDDRQVTCICVTKHDRQRMEGERMVITISDR